MPGIFITFEGGEGSGKSTQLQLLADWLAARGEKVLTTREPGGPPIAESIRELLLNPDHGELLPRTELLLYSASRAQHTGQWIQPALREGRIVLCDRYYDSTFAYQGAARSLDPGFIRRLTAFATFDTVPDLTFLLDLPVEVGLARIAGRELDRLEQEDVNFHQRVRDQYLFLAQENPDRFVVLDGTQSPGQLHRTIREHLATLLGDHSA